VGAGLPKTLMNSDKLPDNFDLEEEARRIINSWFESSPERKNIQEPQKGELLRQLSNKYVQAFTTKLKNSHNTNKSQDAKLIDETVLNQSQFSSGRNSTLFKNKSYGNKIKNK
jgi:hypothetical protein